MADTIIPKPNPTAAVQPTFEPAPAPTPAAPTPQPAVSPAAAGVAAPGAAPFTATQNNIANPVVGAKQAITNATTPEPLPTAAQATPGQQPAAKPNPNVGPNGSSGPNGQSGLNPGGPAAAPAKAPAAKSTAQAGLDTLAPVNDTIKRMLEGNDPIAAIQYNQILTGNGPKNQALLQGIGMKLKQENLDGQGAGSAALAMLARDLEYGDDQLRANVSADSAKRLYDMNVWGFEKAQEIAHNMDTQKRSDLDAAMKSGQYGAAKELWGEIYPGVPFDEGAAKAASPTASANFNSRMKIVDQFVSQGNAAQAKEVMTQLAKDMPEMFGFPNDPQAALAAVAGIDFTTEAWQNNLAAQDTAGKAARTAALQGDSAALSSAVDQLFSKMTPAAVEAIASSAAKSRSLDEINKILASAGMAPVASTDEAAMLDKQKFAKAVKTFDTMQASKRDVVDNLLDTFAKADPAIGIDPAARQAAKAWLSMHAYGIATDPESGAVTNFTLDDKATPPWDAASPQAYMFMDWPLATFNPDGSVAQRTYNGLTPYSSDYKAGDGTSAKGREDMRLDKAYEQYVFSTPADQRLPMEKWYYASAGGNKPVDEKLLTGSLAKPADSTPVDPMKVTQDLKNKIDSGAVLAPADIEEIKKQNLLPSETSKEAAGNFLGKYYDGYIAKHPEAAKGKILLDGKLVQITRAYQAANMDVARIEYNGKSYYLAGNGKWYDQAPAANVKLPTPIPNPLGA